MSSGDGIAKAVTLVEAARYLLSSAESRGLTVAVAESLTGGEVSSVLVSVPGASAYATRIKSQVLGVDERRLERTGPVDGEVAKQMASAVAELMGADLGLATTGVAGPASVDNHRAGTVHVAVASPWGVVSRELHLEGDRAQVREGATTAVLALAVALLDAAEE